MSRFALKIYAVLLIMGAVPLVASAVLISEVLTFNQDLQRVALETLDDVAVFHRAWARSEGERVKLIGENLARNTALRVDETEEARSALEQAVERHDVLRKAELVRDADVVATARQKDMPGRDTLKLHVRTWSVGDTPRPGGADGDLQLRLTFGIERSFALRYEQLGDRRSLHRGLLSVAGDTEGSLSDAIQTVYYLMLAVVIVLTVGFAVLITTPVSRRVARLAQATEAVAKGDLTVELPVKGHDELAQLTAQFNDMVSEIREARRRLAYLERLSAWQEVARRLAHEIKNPLTPLLLSVQQLDKTFDKYRDRPEVYRQIVTDVVEIVSEEVETLRVLVKEFSEFARLPSADPQPRDVWDFVAQTLRSNPQFADQAEIVELGGPSVRARLDPVLIRRVLVNLVQNAIEAVREQCPDDRHPRIEISLEEADPDTARIVIRDNGPGITPEQAERLFEPYFTTKNSGTGLGLAIVRKILIDHGGDVTLRNRTDDEEGAEAWVELPILHTADVELGTTTTSENAENSEHDDVDSSEHDDDAPRPDHDDTERDGAEPSDLDTAQSVDETAPEVSEDRVGDAESASTSYAATDDDATPHSDRTTSR